MILASRRYKDQAYCAPLGHFLMGMESRGCSLSTLDHMGAAADIALSVSCALWLRAVWVCWTIRWRQAPRRTMRS